MVMGVVMVMVVISTRSQELMMLLGFGLVQADHFGYIHELSQNPNLWDFDHLVFL